MRAGDPLHHTAAPERSGTVAGQVAITGGNGFIGARLAVLLREAPGSAVQVLSRKRGEGKVVRLDDPLAVGQALQGCRAVVHCAFDFQDMEANLHIAGVLGQVCAAAGIRLVHISTAAVYEPFPNGVLTEASPAEPTGTAYKNTKIAIERVLLDQVRLLGLDVVILQPTTVYGPAGGAWTDTPVRELLTGQVVLPAGGNGLCNAVYVDDLCQAAIQAIDARSAAGERILVSAAAPVRWREFFGSYEAMVGTASLLLENGEAPHPPAGGPAQGGPAEAARTWLKRVVARHLSGRARTRLQLVLRQVQARLGRPTVHRPTGAKLDLYSACCAVSIDKARRLLGYEPQFDLRRGMQATAPYVRSTYASARIAGPTRGTQGWRRENKEEPAP